MSSTHDLVLCIKRTDLPEDWLPRRGGQRLDERAFHERIMDTPSHFIDRSEAEKNKDFKQIIPYGLLLSPSGEIAWYSRQGREKRLSGLRSIGIGGHVDREDDRRDSPSMPLLDVLRTGLNRELSEELDGFIPESPPSLLGIINEDETSVGNVHFGVVFSLFCRTPKSIRPGKEVGMLSWCDLKTLQTQENRNRFETWSLLALDLLCRSS
ncbi:MAG: phosphoesterase [Candidatus Riflebacteria bacterium]|nr:phosphoesterase [Candidatus Riflebacteria bacterium]